MTASVWRLQESWHRSWDL